MKGSALVDQVHPSGNVEPRAGFKQPELIVLHYTGMESGKAAVDWLCNPVSKVSCHYLVDVDGSIVQMVDEELRGWHAGVSRWHGVADVNSMSIGIEIQNLGHAGGCPPFPQVQMDKVIRLCLDIMARYGLVPEQVVAHSDVAPGRKIDPGEAFDWAMLARAGVGNFVLTGSPAVPAVDYHQGQTGEDILDVQTALAELGYGLTADGSFEQLTQVVVEAFQRRYRPSKVDGRIDGQTLDLIRRLRAVQETPARIV